MTKAFMGLLVAALVLGVALGAAFAGGVALGKSQGGDTGQPQAFGRFQPGEGAQPGRQFNRQGQDQTAAGARPGGPGQAAGQGSSNGPAGRPQTGEQQDGQNDGPAFQRGDRQGAGGGRSGAAGVFGTIQSVEGAQLTVETRQGETSVAVGPDTRVYRLVEASSEDLQPQAQVRVMGPRSDEGLVEASSVVLVPEGGQDALFPGGGRRRPSP